MAETLHAAWFDGRSSRAHSVLVQLEPGRHGPSLRLERTDGLRTPLVLQHRQVGWPESWSAHRAPPKLTVDLGEHGSLEVEDVTGWQQALAASGHHAPLTQAMQTRWPVLLAVLVFALAALAAFYRWGTPWAATQLTRQVPVEWESRLAERALHDLDGHWLKPSRLPAARQQELRARFDALASRIGPELRRYRGYAPRLRLEFRSGLGANAFALPGGTIVMTDDMVQEAARQPLGDEALAGVLAHEIGHVMHRHTTRMVVEQGVLNVGLGLALGDVSSLLSMGGSLLTGLAYRRSHETESDCFAVALMRQAGLPTAPMADLLLRIERTRIPGKPAEGNAWTTLLSSHPETPQRARDLQDGRRSGCR